MCTWLSRAVSRDGSAVTSLTHSRPAIEVIGERVRHSQVCSIKNCYIQYSTYATFAL